VFDPSSLEQRSMPSSKFDPPKFIDDAAEYQDYKKKLYGGRESQKTMLRNKQKLSFITWKDMHQVSWRR